MKAYRGRYSEETGAIKAFCQAVRTDISLGGRRLSISQWTD